MAIFRNSVGAVSFPKEKSLMKVLERPFRKSEHEDLVLGLGSNPKSIPSKYFYDDRGSEIFSRIMDLPEYYPSRCEKEILNEQADAILDALGPLPSLRITELGAGDGRKVLPLLRRARERVKDLVYCPIDISESALRSLTEFLRAGVPGLRIEPRRLDLETAWADLPVARDRSNLILYLGSTLGNFEPQGQRDFMRRLRSRLRPGDHALIGFDLKKNHRLLQKAYDDEAGVTREFNMNLLRRINRELHADFDESAFDHLASYNPFSGSMESWLVSRKEQTVNLAKAGLRIQLRAHEGIHVETSWKFSIAEISSLALLSGFESVRRFYDQRRWFADDLWACTPNGAFY